MKLRQIFAEADAADKFADVKPGSRVPIEDLDFQDLEKIQKKIRDYENTMYNFSNQKVPGSLRDSVATLKSQIQDTIDNLHSKKVAMKKDFSGNIPPKFKELLDNIKEECSEIVDAYKRTGLVLYRGVKNDTDAFKGKPFDERRAKDSDQRLSDDLNVAMSGAGITAKRDNSIFTSASIGQASNYGTAYIVFPTNGFSFSSSSKIGDFIFDFYKFKEYFLPRDEVVEMSKDLALINPELLKKYFGPNHYYPNYRDSSDLFTNYDDFAIIKNLINDGVLDKKWEKFSSARNLLTPELAVKKLGLFWDNIDQAIKSKHEVVIRAPFYAIHSKHEGIVREYLENYVDKPKKPEGTETFKKGDTVEVMSGEDKGIIGTIMAATDEYADIIDANGEEFYDIEVSTLKKIDPADVAKKSAEALKVGDKVQLISDKHKGKTGTISYIYMNKKELDVDLDDSTYLYSISKGDVEKIQPTTSVPAKTFELGDNVTVVQGPKKGKTGKVAWAAADGEKLLLNLGEPDDPYPTLSKDVEAMDFSAPKKSQATDPFKPGDKIEVVKGYFKGKTGVVDQYVDSMDQIDIVASDGDYITNISVDHVQKINDNNGIDQEKLKLLFNKGKQSGHITYAELDKVLPADKVSSEQIEDAINMLSDLGISVVENEPTDTIKDFDTEFEPLVDLSAIEVPDVGDKVMVVNHPSAVYNNMKGVVKVSKETPGGDYVITVQLDDGGGLMTNYDKYFKKIA